MIYLIWIAALTLGPAELLKATEGSAPQRRLVPPQTPTGHVPPGAKIPLPAS